MKCDPNAPAFPQHVAPAYRQEPAIWGMTTRAYIAARMMAAIVWNENELDHTFSETAKAAVVAADALIAELNK